MRVNHQIRTKNLRVVTDSGEMLGILGLDEALKAASDRKLDLVEVAPDANPPVAKIIDFSKFRYNQQKKEKEGRKSQHQVKIKEIKLKPNIDTHDLETKLRKARDFLQKGCKVRVTCVFRGREMVHKDIGREVVERFCEELSDCSQVESPPKMAGRMLSLSLAPGKGKPSSKNQGEKRAEAED